MDTPEVPPERTASVKVFDPLVLDRSLIAIPLLQKMEAELKLIDDVKRELPKFLERYNSAVKLNAAYPGGRRHRSDKRFGPVTTLRDERYPPGLEGALAHARDLAKESEKKAHAGYRRKIDRLREEERTEREIEQEKARRTEWAGTMEHQKIEEPYQDTAYCFAVLHAEVVRRLLAANERTSEDPAARPIEAILPSRFEIIIDLNLEHPGGREAARTWVLQRLPVARDHAGVRDSGQQVHVEKSRNAHQYLFARLEARAIQELVRLDMLQATAAAEERRASTHDPKLRAAIEPARYRAIYHIWPDFEISACINRSIATVKADAAQISFSARGNGIVWAVADSGIDHTHQHFTRHSNIDPKSQWHRDFTDSGDPFFDENGHGTHVAGILAGEWRVPADTPENQRPLAVSRYRKSDSKDIEYQQTRLDHISGMAPECRLVSLKVLDEDGKGTASSLIAAIAHVQEINGYGRRLLIHGINMSLGYMFEPEWFACGQSPLCVEVDRLVKTGVVVVVAAGNTGYGTLRASSGSTAAGMALTINDPGNADLAITVGATHREMPHLYGVSYFSSKGPTGDGRCKPDLVAPGEKIVSCATGLLKNDGAPDIPDCKYVETSGTSMAAPHVSGVIAAFLSVRPEFIGKAERVKEIFCSTATDLRRDRYFQGAGLIDLMRAIQSI
jgi:subtilisin family serine protease